MNNVKKISLTTFVRETRKDLYPYLGKLIEENGDVFAIDVFPLRRMYFLLAPVYMKHILYDNRLAYIKPPLGISTLNDALEEYGLLTTENYTVWHRDRDILNPLFSEKNITKFADIMVQTIAGFLDQWEEYAHNQKPMNIDWAMVSITLTIVLKCIFGNVTVDHRHVNDVLRQIIYEASAASKFLGFIQTPKFIYTHKKTKRELHALGDYLIEQCLANKSDKDNIISLLAEGYQQQNFVGEEMKKSLRSEAVTFLAAGHETTTAVLVWTFVYLSLFPHHAVKIQEEVKKTLGNRLPTYQDLDQLPYLRAVVKESLRLHPPIDIESRQAIQDDAIGQIKISKNEFVVFAPYLMHRISKYWPNPEGFDPERFLKPMDESYKFVYMPFGAGPRVCIGQYFAFMEISLILAMVAQRYNLFLTSSSSITREMTLFHRLNNKITMTVHKL